jgi:hypothetical protein
VGFLQNAVYRDKAEFHISSSGSHTAPLAVVVDGPTSTIPAEINDVNGSYEVSFVPTEVGEHTVDVRFGDTLVPGSPFKVMVGDPKRVLITEKGNALHACAFHLCCLGAFLITLCCMHRSGYSLVTRLCYTTSLHEFG